MNKVMLMTLMFILIVDSLSVYTNKDTEDITSCFLGIV